VEKVQELQKIGINVATMKKGDFYTNEQVREAYHILEPKLQEKLDRHQRGEIGDPMSFACRNVVTAIEKIRQELGLENLVLRCPEGGIKVLTDAESVAYLNNQANAGLKKHKAKTAQLFTHVDVTQLGDKDKKQLEANQRRHAFIAAAAQGARTQSLRMQRKGLQLPDYSGNPET
jgi:hypothetical protein